MHSEGNDRKNLRAINLSLLANVLLAALKTTVGIAGHSRALLADGIMSTSDVVYLIIVRIFMGLAGKPPDREHPYGHRQLEGIAGVVVGAFVITTAVAIFWEAVVGAYQLLSGRVEEDPANVFTLWVAVFTIVLKVCLTVFTRRVARRTGSIAVSAVARDHRNDIFSISAASVGIYLSRAGYVWLDPAAAAVVAVVILYTGITIVRDSSADLMDISAGKPIGRRIRKLVEVLPGVEQIEDVRVHRFGYYLLVDVTIGVNGQISVAQGDRIASEVERTLWRNIEYLRHVTVHFHPSRRVRMDGSGE